MIAGLLLAAVAASAIPTQDAATLVQSNDCAGCHGVAFKGTVMGPALYGIEHRRTLAQIANAIANPALPMPTAPLTATQVRQVAIYLSALDGNGAPAARLDPPAPKGSALLTVTFPGRIPGDVVALPQMRMGGASMNGTPVALRETADPRVFRGTVSFSMAGPWTIDVIYDGKHLVVPVSAGGP
jgi:hypothetical protein